MKFPLCFSVIILTISCSKNTDINYPDSSFVKAKYDTTAIDSFAPGATPNNVKPKVLIIKDSLSDKKKELEDKIKALEKQKESDKEKKEKEKKKQEEKAKEQPKPSVSQSANDAEKTT